MHIFSRISLVQDTKSTYNSIFSFESKSNHYDHRVTLFTTKNKKKIIRTFKRFSKSMTKTRQIMPQAMCRHMVGGITHLTCCVTQQNRDAEKNEITQNDERGKLTDSTRTTQSPHPTAQSINVFDVCHFLSFCDLILKHSGQLHK